MLRSLYYLENKRWSSITGLQVWYLCGEHQGRDNNELKENCSYRTWRRHRVVSLCTTLNCGADYSKSTNSSLEWSWTSFIGLQVVTNLSIMFTWAVLVIDLLSTPFFGLPKQILKAVKLLITPISGNNVSWYQLLVSKINKRFFSLLSPSMPWARTTWLHSNRNKINLIFCKLSNAPTNTANLHLWYLQNWP